MSWYHPIEEHQVGAILGYQDDHPDTKYLIQFADGESYVCEYFTSYESENGGELGIAMDDPRYDEFYVVSLDIVESVSDGPRRYNDTLSLDYRDFPSKITDAVTGTVVYCEPITDDG
jgi:hypothetical protein